MTEIQTYLLKLLEEIDRICISNSIDYYIFAGSMLGIERNEGFLPWDDDIDIVMTKKNYDKFCDIIEEIELSSRTFVCIEKNKDYPLHFGKYVSTETSHLMRSLAFGDCAAGIWIDVMYVVPLPTDIRNYNRIKKWFPVFCELENELYVEYRNHYDGFWKRYRFLKALSYIFGKKRVLKKMKQWLTSYSEEKCKEYFLFHSLGSDFRVYSRCFFEKPVRRKYEGLEVNVSPYNRSFCRAGYGDSWMVIPDEEIQETHLVVLDFEFPYYRYMSDYMSFLDREKVKSTIKKTKQLDLKNDIKRKKYYIQKDRVKAILIKLELEKTFERLDIDPYELVCCKKYNEIDDIYKHYLDTQFSIGFMWWKIFIPISDEILYPILIKLICRDGLYYEADKILNLRKEYSKNYLSEKLETLEYVIELLRNLSISIWDKKNYEEAKHYIKTVENILCDIQCIDLDISKLYIEAIEGNEMEKCEKVKKECKKCIVEYGERGEFYKILGDVELKCGEKRLAKLYYEKAKKVLRNGLLLLELEKQVEKLESVV